jgi:hypothetical protein
MWIRKVEIKAHIIHMSLKAIMKDIWYLDSGFLKYMIGKKEFLVV